MLVLLSLSSLKHCDCVLLANELGVAQVQASQVGCFWERSVRWQVKQPCAYSLLAVMTMHDLCHVSTTPKLKSVYTSRKFLLTHMMTSTDPLVGICLTRLMHLTSKAMSLCPPPEAIGCLLVSQAGTATVPAVEVAPLIADARLDILSLGLHARQVMFRLTVLISQP